MPPALAKDETGAHLLTLGVIPQDPPSPQGIAALISTLSPHFGHILIEAQIDDDSVRWSHELLVQSDLSYVFFNGKTEAVCRGQRLVRAVQACENDCGRFLKAIGCVTHAELIANLDTLAQLAGVPIHLFLRGCPTPSEGPREPFWSDVRRVAREIKGQSVGLALSSGAAKGFAHIGVIQVLEENGIEIDVVAGSSMGAYVGSIWAHGHSGPELERLAREMEGRLAMWSLVDPVFPPRRGFVRGFAVKRRLMRSIGAARFGELARPLRVVATNLETLERVVFSGGEVASAVHASIAVPGIFVPIVIDGETYIDGGIVDPLPVDVLREMGITRVIAVDVIPTPDKIRAALQAQREVAQRGMRRGIFRRQNPLNQQLNYFARGNLFETLMRSIQGAQVRVAEASALEADVVLRPEIRDDRWLDYRTPGKFIQLGREVAERQLEEIKALTTKGSA